MQKKRSIKFVVDSEHAGSAFRVEQIDGRDHVVVPIVALVEGVIHSATAETPELAPAEEFAKHIESWNGKPITVGHPRDVDGSYIPAGDPQVFNTVVIGTSFNSRITSSGKLKMDIWVDKVKSLNMEGGEEALQRLENRDMVEVSTGYFAEIENTSGEFNGKKYEGIQRNIVPDHLAILAKGEEGACNWAMGCGAPRINMGPAAKASSLRFNEMRTAPMTNKDSKLPRYKKVFEEQEGVKCEGKMCENHSVRFMSFLSERTVGEPEISEDGRIVNLVADPEGKIDFRRLAGFMNDNKEEWSKAAKDLVTNIVGVPEEGGIFCRALNLLNYLRGNELSDVDKREAVKIALEQKHSDLFIYVAAIFDKFVVYEKDYGVLYKIDYTIDNGGSVSLGEDDERVRPETSFVTVNDDKEVVTNGGTLIMGKEEKIKAIIASNANGFTEEDSEFLDKLGEDQLGKIDAESALVEEEAPSIEPELVKSPVAEAEETAGTNTEPDKARTVEEYIAEAPLAVQEVLNESMRTQASKRNTLADSISNNTFNQFTDEEIKNASIETLERWNRMLNEAVTKSVDFSALGGGSLNLSSTEENDITESPSLIQMVRDNRANKTAA